MRNDASYRSFTQLTGQPLDRGADHRVWKALLQAAGVRDARLHDAQHTAATMLLVLGVPTLAVVVMTARKHKRSGGEVIDWSKV